MEFIILLSIKPDIFNIKSERFICSPADSKAI